MKKLKLIGSLGLMLFIGGGVCVTHASAMERHAVYLERNYPDKNGVMHHLTREGYLMAEKEFTNTIDPYTDFQIIDAFNDKNTAIAKLNRAFKNSKENDINYLIIDSHGWNGGIIDFTFQEIKDILDQYQGHFVISIHACESGGAIDRMQKEVKEVKEVFQQPKNKMGEFKNSKYNVFCSSSKTQNSQMNARFTYFTKVYFDGSQINENKNGFLEADYNQDDTVTASELSQYLEKSGKTKWGATPVSQVVDPNLPVFATCRFKFDFYGIGRSSGQDTHIAQLRYNKNHTATIQTYHCKPHPDFKNTYISVQAVDASGTPIFTKAFKGTDQVKSNVETFNLPEGSYLMIYHAEGNSDRFTSSYNQELKQYLGTAYYYVVCNNKLVQTEKLPAQKNSIRLNLKGTDSYLYVENGILCGNNTSVGNSMTVTKNGSRVSQGSGLEFTDLKAGDTFTIEPSHNSTWEDIPVTKRTPLGTFDSVHRYTFKVNNDGSISRVSTEITVAQNNSIRLNLKGTGSYLYVENGKLYGNNTSVWNSMTVTKNGLRVSWEGRLAFTDLKIGDTFTIEPSHNSTWEDEPVESASPRNSLGTFDSAHRYTFKVNKDGSISLVSTGITAAQNNSIRLNLKGTGSYLYVENGNLYGNNTSVGNSMTVTKNGSRVSQGSGLEFTDLKIGDTFTIQPIHNSAWEDEPVKSNPRDSLGTFEGFVEYTFKVNNDGSISLVASKDLWDPRVNDPEYDLDRDMEQDIKHPLPF